MVRDGEEKDKEEWEERSRKRQKRKRRRKKLEYKEVRFLPKKAHQLLLSKTVFTSKYEESRLTTNVIPCVKSGHLDIIVSSVLFYESLTSIDFRGD